jgi:hypothetical protein
VKETQEIQHLRPPAGLTKAEKSAWRTLIGSRNAGKGPVSPDGLADYVRSRLRLRILQRLLNDAVRQSGGWPAQTRILELTKAIDTATSLSLRLRRNLGLAGTESGAAALNSRSNPMAKGDAERSRRWRRRNR